MAREDFLVGDCNEAAVKWLDSWGSWPGIGLIVYGPEACGKTHLARVWQQQAGAEFIKAADLDNAAAERLVTQNVQNVIVDDLESLAEEEALFHLYNHLFQSKGSLLILAERPPKRLEIILPDLRSRLQSLPSAEITLPDETVLSAVFLKHFHDRQIMLDADVLTYILPRIERSFGEVARLVDLIDKKALAEKRRITVPLVRDLLRS